MCLFRWDQKLFAMQPSVMCKKTNVVCYLFTFLQIVCRINNVSGVCECEGKYRDRERRNNFTCFSDHLSWSQMKHLIPLETQFH